MGDWTKISTTYTPVRGDILKSRLFYDDEIYIVELIKPCNGKEWYVREDKSFHRDFKVDRKIIDEVLVDKSYYDRRLILLQNNLDECMNMIIRLRAERMKRFGR